MPDMAASFERHVRLTLDESKLTAGIAITPGIAPGAITADALRAYLDAKAVRAACIDQAAVDDLAALASSGVDEPVEATIARGDDPVHGTDARLDYTPDITEQFDKIKERKQLLERRRELGDAEDDNEASTDAVNLRNISAFVVVPADTAVGTVTEATPGQDGQDVFGETVRAKSGRSLDIEIGDGLRTQRGAVLSTRAGLLAVTRSSVSVSETLTVNGAVDFNSGNIDFPGDVEISKGIRDCFSINAAGNVTLGDLAEAAEIDCEGSLALRSGMAGREKGILRVGRDLSAMYLDGVEGLILGNARIAREINNCTLDIRGRLDADGAAIRGGTITIAGRAAVSQIGGEGGIRTELVIGAVPDLEPLVARTVDVLKTVEDRAVKAARELKDLESNLTKLTANQAERLTELQFEVSSGGSRGDGLRQRARLIFDRLDAAATTHITINRALHRGVVLWVRGWRIEPKDTIKGPITILLSDDGMPAYHLPKGDPTPVSLAALATLRPDNRVPALPELPEAA